MSAGQVFRNVAVLGATGVGFGPVQGFGPAIVNSFLSNGKFKTNVRFLYRADSGKVQLYSISVFCNKMVLTFLELGREEEGHY
jgi:hypothetical protein